MVDSGVRPGWKERDSPFSPSINSGVPTVGQLSSPSHPSAQAVGGAGWTVRWGLQAAMAGSPWGWSPGRGPLPRLLPPPPSGPPSVPTVTPLQRLTFDEGSGRGVNSPSAWTDRQMAGDTVVGRPDLSCGPFRPSPPPSLPALPFTVDKGTRTPGCGVGSCVHCVWAPRWAAGPLRAGRPPGPAPPRATLAAAQPGSPDCPRAMRPMQAPCEAHHQKQPV